MRETMTKTQTRHPAVVLATILAGLLLGAPHALAQCKPPKQSYQGRCVYPDEIPSASPAKPTPAVTRPAPVQGPAPTTTPRIEPPGREVNGATSAGTTSAEVEPSNPSGKDEGDDVRSPQPDAERPASDALPPPPSGGRSPLVFAGFGLGAVGLVVGTATGIAALSKDRAIECPGNLCPRELEGDVGTVMALAHVSTASFVVGGVGAALAVVGLAITPSAAEAPVAMRVGPGGFEVAGRF